MTTEEDAQRRAERIQFLSDIAQELLETGVLPQDTVVLRSKRMPLVVDAYFIISDAFKRWRILESHLTEDPKIAAIHALAIMSIAPFRAVAQMDAKTVAEAKSNEIFSLNVIAAIIGVPLDASNPTNSDFWLRMMDVLTDLDSETIEAFKVDTDLSIKKPPSSYHRELSEGDKHILNYLICITELLSGKIRDA